MEVDPVIADPLLRAAVTLLCVLAAGISLTGMAGGRVSGAGWVGEPAHLAMAVAMGVMAWPAGARLPVWLPMVFFAAATLWFAVRAVLRGPACGGPFAVYHAAMMAAMTWMYAVMGGLLPGQAGGGHSHDGGRHTMMPDMPMGDMPMGDLAGPGAGAGHEGGPGWITGVNAGWTVFFAVAAAALLYRYFAGRRDRADVVPGELSWSDAGVLGQAMMAAAMAVMFGVTL